MRRIASTLGRAVARLVGVIACLAIVGTATAATVRLVEGRARAAAPQAPAVLHAQGTRSGMGPSTTVDAWLDLATGEGKLVETAADGSLRRVLTVNGTTAVLYLADGRHAVIRRGSGPALQDIRQEVLGYRLAAERGTAKVVGTGRRGDRPTERVQAAFDGRTVLAEIDQATGLALREEISGPDGAQQARETAYRIIEHRPRPSLPADAFHFALPADAGREEYIDGDPADPGAGVVGLGYAVYAAPADAGKPAAAFRATSSGRGVPPSDAYYLIYRIAAGEVQIVSGTPPDPTTLQLPGRGPYPLGTPQRLQVGGVTWEVAPGAALSQPNALGRFQASAAVGDSYVTISAPDRSTFERFAAALRRVTPR